MKSCVVAIAKYEGDYIREWVEYNLNIGFNHIFIGDNNDDNQENIREILNDYVIKGLVTIIDIKDFYITQIDFYKMAFNNLVGRFDWVLFYDIDEFLVLNNFYYVNDYLSQKKFDKFDVIKINQKIMSNDGYVVYINKPVLERFKKEGNNYAIGNISDNDNKEHIIYMNNTVKSFYKTSAKLLPSVHSTEKYYPNIKYCDNRGKEIKDKDYWPNWSQVNEKINHDDAYIKHFATKSLEEYVKYKIKRGWSCFKNEDQQKYVKDNYLNLDVFEKINGKSTLYKKLYDEYLIKFN